MKKNIILLSIGFALIAGLTSCTGGSKPKNTALKTEADSLSYAFGRLNAQGLNQYLSQSLQLDTLKVLDNFLEGFISAVRDTSAQARAYRAGVSLGDRVAGQFAGFEQYFFEGTDNKVNRDAFVLAFYQAAKGANMKMTLEEAGALLDAHQARAMEKEFGANKTTGDVFLAENATKEGVTVLPSGLQYRVIREGKGAKPAAESEVKVHYVGRFIDGTVFDSSIERGEPVVFPVNEIISGWTEGLQLMPAGSKWELFIPQELAYGAQGSQNPFTGEYTVPPFSALIFEVELLEIVK